MYKDYIIKLVKEIIGDKNVVVEIPPKKEMGDYSVPCFSFKDDVNKNPLEIANKIKENISDEDGIFASVKTMGPYVNFYLNYDKASNIIKEILDKKSNYGSLNQGHNDALLIEHTSINPNAEPHMGRCRNSLIGDFLANLFKFVGYEVERHYFINDLGKKIAFLVIGVEKYGLKTDSFSDILDVYVKISNEAKTDEALEQKAFDYLELVESGNQEMINKFKSITDKCVEGQMKIFNELEINFDVFTHESDYVYNNYLTNILNKIDEKGKLKLDENGRYYVDLSDYDIPTKEPVLVLTRSNKTSLYPIKDIAYTMHKMDLNSTNNYIVLGEDQEVYMKQIAATLDILGYKAPKLISYSYVLLDGDKMSTSNGTLVLVTDFIKALREKIKKEFENRNLECSEDTLKILTNACIKYTMLNVSRNKIVNFNFDNATSFTGESAIYILYSIVRINSILRNNKYENTEIKLTDELEYQIVKDLIEFPSLVNDLLVTSEPVLLTKYIFNLTQKFSSYYEKVNISNITDVQIKNSKLLLLEAIKIVLTNGLSILGIKTIEKM